MHIYIAKPYNSTARTSFERHMHLITHHHSCSVLFLFGRAGARSDSLIQATSACAVYLGGASEGERDGAQDTKRLRDAQAVGVYKSTYTHKKSA